ncbi:MAG: glycosyltransferase family 4 protein [Bacteroidales bacterium]|nr:glycosyltransferase family 4 protein [Bacteroidales bacterium]MDD3990066.1 glycosyltransferase family 4 protein [Bacteroidales bacterium]MDD4638264.1 glycosyltransferase family 4 protein [Bacteroidales bacterium]
MKKAVIITYYWPPAGGSGVQRWLKFVKYFRNYGIEPVVYTPENPEMMAVDSSLLSEIPQGATVIKRRITEPYGLYKLLTGKSGEQIKPGFITDGAGKRGGGWKESLSLFIRSNLFIPDPKCLWIRPSVKFLTKYLKDNPVDIIISTGPPHSMHLIAEKVAKATNIPWIADFRDPWTGMYTFKSMKNSPLTVLIHKKMEKRVVREADAVVVVTNYMKKELSAHNPRRAEVITNGFDKDDYRDIVVNPDKEFSITYTGLFVKDRNPSQLWRVLGEKAASDKNFKKDLIIKIIGHTDKIITDEILANGLENNLYRKEYVPHREAIALQKSARVLLLAGGQQPEAAGILTGKFFEYLASGNKILAFGPAGGDMDTALRESGAGEMFEYNDYQRVKEWIEREYERCRKGETGINSGDIDKYSREKLCEKMSVLIEDILSKKENKKEKF